MVAPVGHPTGPAVGRAGRSSPVRFGQGQVSTRTCGPAITRSQWLTRRMVTPLPEPDREIDPNEPVPDDPAELLPDAPEQLPPPPIEATPDDPGGDPGGVPEPA